MIIERKLEIAEELIEYYKDVNFKLSAENQRLREFIKMISEKTEIMQENKNNNNVKYEV